MILVVKMLLFLAGTSTVFGKSIKVQIEFEDIMKLIQNFGGSANFRQFASSMSDKLDIKTETPRAKYNNPYHPEDDKSDVIDIKVVRNDITEKESEDKERTKILNKSVALLEKDNDNFISSGKNMLVSEDELTEMIEDINGPPPKMIKEENESKGPIKYSFPLIEDKEISKESKLKSGDGIDSKKYIDAVDPHGVQSFQRRYQLLNDSVKNFNEETGDKKTSRGVSQLHPENVKNVETSNLLQGYPELKDSIDPINRVAEGKEAFEHLDQAMSKDGTGNNKGNDVSGFKVLQRRYHVVKEPTENVNIATEENKVTNLHEQQKEKIKNVEISDLLDGYPVERNTFNHDNGETNVETIPADLFNKNEETSDLQGPVILPRKYPTLIESLNSINNETVNKKISKDLFETHSEEFKDFSGPQIWHRSDVLKESDISSVADQIKK